ncbi:MAG: rhomboid family intramembrane serine protease [Dehalococcoidia bacterium]|nr:rhomboid family intramembrane serine protease [Dehalococcoidia bacterium]
MTYRSQGSSPIAAWALIAINLLMFVVTIIIHRTNPNFMYYTFGLSQVTFLDRPWTLVTSMFIHAGVWHILANMVTLYFFGSYLNRLLGTGKFLIIYFAGGILGSIVYLLLAPSYSIAIGASGAIFALGGVLAVMRPRLRVIVFPIPAPLPLWIAIIGIFVVFSFLPNVAWQAHAGGLALGLVVGYIFRRRERYRYY